MFFKKISLFLFIAVCGNLVSAQKYLSKEVPEISKNWNQNTFTSSKTFQENIAEAPEFSKLAKILKDENLSKMIEAEEMVTIFALNDQAFYKLNKKERDSVTGNKILLSSIIKYLIVPGRIDEHGLVTEAKNHGGKFYLSTVNGENLGVIEKEGKIYLEDSEGRQAAIIATDFYHKNGFFHIIDSFVFPSAKE